MTMKGVSKTAILPVVSVVALAIAAITGHKFNQGTIDEFSTVAAIVITAGINVWGIIKNHKKEVK
jgi:hypothetical protein